MKNKYTLSLALYILFSGIIPSPSYGLEKCPDVKSSIKIIDNNSGEIRELKDMSAETYPEFIKYVHAVSEHVIENIRSMPKCDLAAKANRKMIPEAEMVFVYTPLAIKAENDYTIPAKKGKHCFRNCTVLDSPWASISIDQTSGIIFYGAFHWNQRQFLQDQAILDGAKDLQPAEPLIMDEETISFYGNVYWKLAFDTRIPSERAKEKEAFAQMKKKTPEDIIWLYRYGVSDTPSWVHSAMKKLPRNIVDDYIALNNAMLDKFFEQKEEKVHFSTINDVQTFFDVKRLDQQVKQ